MAKQPSKAFRDLKTRVDLKMRLHQLETENKLLKEEIRDNESQHAEQCQKTEDEHYRVIVNLKRDLEVLKDKHQHAKMSLDDLQVLYKGEKFKIMKAMDVTEDAASAMSNSSRVTLKLMEHVEYLERHLEDAKRTQSRVIVTGYGGGGGGGSAVGAGTASNEGGLG